MQGLRATAQHHGIRSQTFDATFRDVRPLSTAQLHTLQIELTDTSAGRQTLGTRPSPKASSSNQKKRKKHPIALQAIEKQYGVPYTILIAIWCIESNFGRNPTSFYEIDALVTLAYGSGNKDFKRFFETGLLKTLKLIDESSVSATPLPVSQLSLPPLTPWNSDDIHSVVDKTLTQELFASIAKYLYNSGWKENEPWGHEVKVSHRFKKSLASLSVQKNSLQWERLGVTFPPRPRNELPPKMGSILHINGRWFIVYPNFRVLLKWNPSINFALSVGLLSNQIRMESAQ